jgi:hypothetical protein
MQISKKAKRQYRTWESLRDPATDVVNIADFTQSDYVFGKKRALMRSIRKLVVRARHWQMFVVFIGLYTIGYALVPNRAPADVLKAVTTYWLPTYALNGCFLLWPWFLGTSLADIAPPATRPKRLVLSTALLFAFIYMPISGLVPLSLSTFPLDVLSVCGIFYAFYFVSKSLLLAESGSPPDLKSVVLPFLMFFFFPIGMWFFQPRINRLFREGRPGATSEVSVR